MGTYNVIFFEKSDGSRLAYDFMVSIDKKMSSKVFWTLDVLKHQGPDMRLPYSKHLGDGIFEIRTKVASDITRVLYFFVYGKNIVMTNGFVKKTQKTPKNEIDTAKKYRDEYLSR